MGGPKPNNRSIRVLPAAGGYGPGFDFIAALVLRQVRARIDV
jgi:hypothetical protein